VPTLTEIASGNASLTQTVFTTDNLVVEPLNGPQSVEDLMDRFPEEVYHQGRDTHLFRLLQALCGDSGAGLAKKQAYAARLKYEAEFVSFDILNDVYVAQFQFQRLRSETYTYNADADALTPTQWNLVELADQRYYQRVAKFWTAVRYGNNGEGIRLAAESGTGVTCDISPQYRFIFDQYSDLALGLKPDGITPACEEVAVLPRFDPGNDVSYVTPYERVWEFTSPTLDGGVSRPVPAPVAQFAAELSYVPPPQAKIDVVGSATGAGETIAIPPHLPGDLILIVAANKNRQPTIPAAGGTVPAFSSPNPTETSSQTMGLYLLVGTAVATDSGHTSGTWAGAAGLNALVLRPTNGTIAPGNFSVYRWNERGEPQSPYVTWPSLDLDNENGTSAVVRMVTQSETTDSNLDAPPVGYTWAAGVGLPFAKPYGLATHYRAAVLDDPPEERTRGTSSNGPLGFVAYSFEVKIAPNPGAYVETKPAREERYTVESDQLLVKDPFFRLLPEIERNAVELIDRLRPVSSAVTFKPETARYDIVPIETPPVASSERMNVTRFVTGNASVPWPDTDPESNLFMVAGVETEPGNYYGMNRDLPVVFLDVESEHAYTGEALLDPTYGSNSFYTAVNNVSPYEQYRSEHTGAFFPVIGAIFPFLLNVLPSAGFTAEQAVASQNTPLVFEGSFLDS